MIFFPFDDILCQTKVQVPLCLVEVGLLHDAQELVQVDLAVTVPICLVNHFLGVVGEGGVCMEQFSSAQTATTSVSPHLQLLVRELLAQLFRYPLQILKADLALERGVE